MGDGFSGVDGSPWYRNLQAKFKRLRELVTEIYEAEPHLKDRIKREVSEAMEKGEKDGETTKSE